MTRVLIVDDEPLILQTVSRLLGNAGFDTHTCHLWPGVASLMRSTDPHLVLLDYNMPGVNGGDLCRILKRSECCSNAKILLFSAEDETDLVRIVRECGADGYIKKNTPPSQLVEALHAAAASVLEA